MFSFQRRLLQTNWWCSNSFPLKPTLANFFLVYHEHKWLESFPIQFRPIYYRRYVDGIFLTFGHKNHIKKFLRYINLRHRNIHFTCEEESNAKISFLEISRTRSNNKLVTSLYRKKTFSGIYMNYNSFLPTNYKKALINTLLFRFYNICADYSVLHNEIKYLKTICQKNPFLLFFIDNCINFF